MAKFARSLNILAAGARSLGSDALSERVRRMLVRTLYTQPASLAIGAFTGSVGAWVAAYVSGKIEIVFLSALLSVIAIARVAGALSLACDDQSRSTRLLEFIYEIGAFSYAFVLGATAAVALLIRAGPQVEILLMVSALCYGVGICARNAGRPVIAMGQLSLVVLPVVIALLVIGTLPFVFLAANLMLLVVAMMTITINLFKVLRESIGSAETNERLAAEMRHLARIDVVTGLANRAGLDHDMTERLRSAGKDTILALFWLDLDRFKEINDLFGHPVGDQVLAQIAARLAEVSPDHATVARFGGDEFIVFCEVADRHESERLASEIHAEIMRPVGIDRKWLEVHASIGVALLPEDASSAATLMQNADLALYHAKVNGRRQTCFYAPSMNRDLARKREIEAELRAAILKDELSVYFQPVVDLESGRIRGFEALVRWFHPTRGELMPDEFIPLAEETGVIVTLGNWITAQAAKAAARWPDDISLAVNLSPLQIKAPGAALGIINAIRQAGLDPSRLELEVTESLLLDDHDATENFIHDLSAIGIKFALDDFGTGYSSLSYVQKYPFSKIKIDRSFVSGPNVGRKTDAIIRAVAELGSKLGMDIVAEGVETIEQVRAVREAGCTLGQGYYFSRAVPDYAAAILLAHDAEEHNPRRARA
ncbi:EAL domain-containing protein [Sphingorhabdus soli]|uniref:EAL domain-containing protein n=1 Tax=Flavisphingopyxis soli TaxID=2601267 RepID=A0A5C6U487_9SPHN|nr:EAL domain-containing protein [Sphingorhabdus soli]TXC67783.1 EAL domain-containing protein [Sphingorhabdus soli]